MDSGPDALDRRDAYSAFAQEDYYREAWEPLLSGARAGSRFNFAAAFFGPTWCFYRKMYGTGLLLYLAALVLGALVGFVTLVIYPNVDVASPTFSLIVTGLILVAIRVPLGAFANDLYFRKATAVIDSASTTGQTQGHLLAHLKQAGGTSAIGVVAAIAINVVLRFLV